MPRLHLIFYTIRLYSRVWPKQGIQYHLQCFCRDVKHIFCTPMINSSLMELEFGTWEASFYCRDTTGRLLGENSAIQNHPSIEWKETHFSGNRKGKPYNLSAFKQIADEWQNICHDTVEIRTAYLKYCNKKNQALNIADLYYISRFVTSHSAYLIRKKSPFITPYTITTRSAALYKVMAGIHMTIIHMLGHHDILGDEIFTKAIDVEELYSYIEENHIFEVSSGQVCGGPQKMVIELIKLIIYGNENLHSTYLADTYGDIQASLEYAIHCARIDIALMLNDCVKIKLLMLLFKKQYLTFEDSSFIGIIPYHIKPERLESLDKGILALKVLIEYHEDKSLTPFPAIENHVDNVPSIIIDSYRKHDELVISYFNEIMGAIFLCLNKKQEKSVTLSTIFSRSKANIIFKKLENSA